MKDIHWESQFVYSHEVFVDFLRDSFPNVEFLCEGSPIHLRELADFLTWIKAKQKYRDVAREQVFRRRELLLCQMGKQTLQSAAASTTSGGGATFYANQVDPLVVLNEQIIALSKFQNYKCFELKEGRLDEAQLFQYIQSKGLKLMFEHRG